jgi:hypothetical protein
MSAFAAQRAAFRTPARTKDFPPSIFMDAWQARPTKPTTIGLRVPSDYEYTLARANAAQMAAELHPNEASDGRIDTFNDALVRELCAAGMCSPTNVFEPFFPTPEDDVRTKLTSEGAKSVWQEIERLAFETSPVHREADDEEMALVSAALVTPEIIDGMPAFRAKRIRRLIAFVLDELETLGG